MDDDWASQFAGHNAVGIGKTFKFARRKIVAFDHRARRDKRLERSEYHLLTLVHAKRGSLDNDNVFVFIDDESAEEIAFSIDHAKDVAAGRCFCRMARAARIRSSKNA